jgi:hypothetical protein
MKLSVYSAVIALVFLSACATTETTSPSTSEPQPIAASAAVVPEIAGTYTGSVSIRHFFGHYNGPMTLKVEDVSRQSPTTARVSGKLDCPGCQSFFYTSNTEASFIGTLAENRLTIHPTMPGRERQAIWVFLLDVKRDGVLEGEVTRSWPGGLYTRGRARFFK